MGTTIEDLERARQIIRDIMQEMKYTCENPIHDLLAEIEHRIEIGDILTEREDG